MFRTPGSRLGLRRWRIPASATDIQIDGNLIIGGDFMFCDNAVFPGTAQIGALKFNVSDFSFNDSNNEKVGGFATDGHPTWVFYDPNNNNGLVAYFAGGNANEARITIRSQATGSGRDWSLASEGPNNVDGAFHISDDSGGKIVFRADPNSLLAKFIDYGILLPVGTTALAPLAFQSGTNLTTPAVGACEFDGKVFYQTAVASSRQIVDTEQLQILSATRTFTSNTSAQAIFNATANGAFNAAASTTYEFEMWLDITGFSTSTHTISLGFALGGGASLTNIAYYVIAGTQATPATPTAPVVARINTASATAIIGSQTTANSLLAYVRGTMRVNAAGTITPQITQNTNSAAAVAQINSFMRFWPAGSNTVNSVGNFT